MKVVKFTFFSKALVYDFLVENFMFFYLSFFWAKLIKRVFGDIRETKNPFLVYKNIDISKLQNLNFLQRGYSIILVKVSSPCFFLVQIDRKECLATFFILKSLFFPKIPWFLKGEKLAFFAKSAFGAILDTKNFF